MILYIANEAYTVLNQLNVCVRIMSVLYIYYNNANVMYIFPVYNTNIVVLFLAETQHVNAPFPVSSIYMYFL
jgi:hypothetical protein